MALMWLNWSVATIIATLQLLDIYRLGRAFSINHTINIKIIKIVFKKKLNSA